MKNLLAFMKPVSVSKDTSSSTPITDRSLEQWGARTVVDAKVCRKLEEELTKAKIILGELGTELSQAGNEIATWSKGVIVKGTEEVRAFRAKLMNPQSKPTCIPANTTPEKVSKAIAAIQNDIRQGMKERIRAYVNRQQSQGKTVTIQKVQNSFSPEYPPKALVQEILKELGV